jgi:uncharacterized membrane protein SpoIIM required for sporulation
VQGESVVMFWGTYESLWWGVFGLAVLGVLLARVGLAHFQREELLGREIDVLNVRWMVSVFVTQFKGGAHSLGEWWRKALPASIRRLGRPMLVVTLIMAAGIYIGTRLLSQFNIPLGQDAVVTMNARLRDLVHLWPMFSVAPVIAIWWQNIRVLILAMLLGLFSFGILGMIPVFATMVLAGYLLALLSANGLPVMAYLAFIIPHGIVEIPAALLATAAMLQAGAILVTPTPGKTFGEVMISAIAEWAKIMVGVVIPLLLIGACIEAWITPRIAILFL